MTLSGILYSEGGEGRGGEGGEVIGQESGLRNAEKCELKITTPSSHSRSPILTSIL